MVVTVTTPGHIDDDSVVVYGVPGFTVGEDVLLYLSRIPTGTCAPPRWRSAPIA
jgi:hypothetical protein